MTPQPYTTDTEHNILTWIRDGMPVYDRDDNKVGKVKFVYFGENSAEGTAKPSEFYNLPDELQGRLAHDGFVQIDAGLLRADRIALPEQIAEMRDEQLRLNVTAAELFTV